MAVVTPPIRDLAFDGSTLRVSWADALRTPLPRDHVITWPSDIARVPPW